MSGGGRVRLSAQDASFLDRADQGAPLNVAGLIRLQQSPRRLGIERVRELVGERLALIPRLRQRAVTEETSVVWADDPAFDIERHVDELPMSAGDPSLVGHIAQLHATPLDPAHPLWKLSIAAGDAERGPAILFRASHALVDGMSSMHVMRRLFDPIGGGDRGERDAADRGTSAPKTPGLAADVNEADAFDVVRDLWQTMRPRDRRDLGPDEYERALALLDGWISMLERGWHGGPRLASDRPVKCRLALTALDSAALRSLRRRLDVRFDVIGLTITAAALGRLFEARGESSDTRIRTLVPVAAAGARDATISATGPPSC